MGNKYVRVYDIRTDPGSNPIQFATKAVHGITVDPFSPYRAASYSEEGIIKLWDLRKTNDAILTLNPDSKTNLSKIAFSPTQPGFLASLTKDSFKIDLWDIQESCSLQSAVNSSLKHQQQQQQLKSNHSTPYQQHRQQSTHSATNAIQALSSQYEDADLSVPVLWRTRKTSSSVKKFASFAFIPNDTHSKSNNTHNILAIHLDGKLESVRVQEPCQVAWQPTGGMIMTNQKGLLSHQPNLENNPIESRITSLVIQDEKK